MIVSISGGTRGMTDPSAMSEDTLMPLLEARYRRPSTGAIVAAATRHLRFAHALQLSHVPPLLLLLRAFGEGLAAVGSPVWAGGGPALLADGALKPPDGD